LVESWLFAEVGIAILQVYLLKFAGFQSVVFFCIAGARTELQRYESRLPPSL